jgi:hypothetical protein
MFMVSCSGLSRAGVHHRAGGPSDTHAWLQAVGFLTRVSLRQSARARNAQVDEVLHIFGDVETCQARL